MKPFALSGILYCLFFFCSGFIKPLHAQKPGSLHEKYRYDILKTDEPIAVDGVLSEKAWQDAPVASGFLMSYPVDDRRVEESLQTEVRLLYDENHLYLGIVCHGDDEYLIRTLKRDADFWNSDAFGVVLDPVNERTNGFVFGVTAAGVQTDYLVTGESGRREVVELGEHPRGENIAWDNKWFSSVTIQPGKWIIEIAIPFKILWFVESGKSWGINFFRRDAGTNSIHTWTPVPIEFRETNLGYTGSLWWEEAPEKATRHFSVIPYILGGAYDDLQEPGETEFDLQGGLDVKIPVTSSLGLDLTLNPDFSQVEVDEQVTNLTLFDINLPEKRHFFLENSDIFEDFGISPLKPFFSRRIGLDRDGNPIPILYGARLSGNLNKDLRIGAMNLQTRASGNIRAQNYTLLALHQQVFARSVIKGYFHNRQAIKGTETDYSRNVGLEALYRSVDGRFQTVGGYGKQFRPGVYSRNHFYSLIVEYDSRNISAYFDMAGIGEQNKSELGYIFGQEHYDAARDTSIRIGFNHSFASLAYTMYPGNNDRIISHVFDVSYRYDGDTSFSILSLKTELLYSLRFANTSQLQFSLNHNVMELLFPFSFIGQEPLPAGRYNFEQAELSYQSDQRSLFSLQGGLIYGTFYNGTHLQSSLGIKYRAQPWGNFALNVEQNKLRFPDPYGSDNLFLIGPRIEFNFSSRLFWTTFLQYNTQHDNFNINSRLQWQFQPLSDLYIVYTDNYAVEIWGPKNRALVVKLNYWFNL